MGNTIKDDPVQNIFMTSPLFVKYQTKRGNCYIYDTVKNEIFRVNDSVYELIDDIGILNDEEIVEKYRICENSAACRALAEIKQFQSCGYLCGHASEIVSKAETVLYREAKESFADFLSQHCRFLVLELTQQCNLRCQYCCYGEHYSMFREHGGSTMTWKIAWKAVTTYLDKRPEMPFIGFYGGEPLLEFDLLQKVVISAEYYAKQLGLDLSFNITTNGTLLTDEKIRFLVEHRFGILVSLDGTKKAHDKFRVFRKRNDAGETVGSFDLVMNHLRRFVELYPEYPTRGFALTITPQSDFKETNKLLKKLKPSFPMLVPSFVRDPNFVAKSLSNQNDQPFQWGCLNSCNGGTCGREIVLKDGKKDIPEFYHWTSEWIKNYQESYGTFLEELMESPEEAALNQPLWGALFFSKFYRVHYRSITHQDQQKIFFYSCYPGSTKIFCSAKGKYYPCERIETNSFTELGDVQTGVNPNRAIKLLDIFRNLSDCGNCVARNLCPICPGMIVESAETGHVDVFAFQKECQKIINNLPKLLSEYTEICESAPDFLDKVIKEDTTPNWIKNLKFVITDAHKSDVDLEELSPEKRLFTQ